MMPQRVGVGLCSYVTACENAADNAVSPLYQRLPADIREMIKTYPPNLHASGPIDFDNN